MTAVESDWHPLALLSSQERDEVVGTLPFPDTTHHYYLPETLPFPSDIVINYSQFFATIEPSVRDGNYVPPNELRNGDILQFSEYRQTSTFYVLWLTKNLTSYTRDNYEALLAQRSKYGGQYDYTQKQVSCSVLSTVVTSPSLPRDTLATPDTDQYDCYVFSHLDEYGYLGTSATSMGNEAYFRAIKPERMSEVLLDPLFLHSTSFHGRLLRYVKEKRHELRANPFFPSHYIAKLPSSRDKTSDVTSDHPEETVFDRLCEELEFIPIDLASEQLCSGFSVDRRNPFYLIRNILYLHCTHVLHLPTPDTSLPLINQKYHDCDDVTKFFISNCSSILLTSSPQFSEYVPSLHKLNGYQLYSDETTEELTRHLNPEADDYIDQYNAVVTSMTKRWRALDPDIVKIYEERAANSNVRREQANRDFALYRLFVVDQRVTSLTESEGSRYTSWLDLEKSLVQQWQETSAEVKAKYRSQHDALLVEKQLETDVEGVIRYIGILDSMDRVEAARATFPPPGGTQSLETPPSQTTTTKRRVQDRVLPSAITFRDVKPSSGGGAFGVQASYRPLAGFVTFVLQQYEDKVQERNSVKFVREVVDGWKMLSEEEKEILIAEEKVIEENNKESYRQQQEERRKKNATSGFGGGFGAGFGAPSVGFGAPSVGFGAPAAPSVGFGAPSVGFGVPAAPSVGFGVPAAPSVGFGVPAAPSVGFGAPSVGFGVPAAPSVGFGAPSVGFGVPAAPSVGFGAPSVGFGAPATPAVGFGAPSVGFGAPAAPAVGFKSENTDISISLLEEHTKEDSEA